MKNKRNALYYPSMEFNNLEWLWASALLWDRIYRIVPESYTPADIPIILELMEDGTIGRGISPTSYIHDTANEFISKYNGEDWRAPSLGNYELMDTDYILIHEEKADVRVRNLFARGGDRAEWLEVPAYIGGLYMTYLSNHIAKENGLALITDNSATWCGSNYFYYDGAIDDFELHSETPDKLGSIIIQDFIPQNLLDISPKDLLKFREKRKDERHRFLDTMDELTTEISQCKDPKVIADIIEDQKREIIQAKNEFKKSLDMVKVSGWIGVKSALVPVISPVLTSLMQLPDPTKLGLNMAGLLFGGIAGFLEVKQKTNALKKGFSYNYLLEIKGELARRRVCFSGYTDYNSFIEYEMNNFIHD